MGSIPSAAANIESSSAVLSTTSVDLQKAQADIGLPTGDNVRIATETRPANMRVVYIMKIQPSDWVPPEK